MRGLDDYEVFELDAAAKAIDVDFDKGKRSVSLQLSKRGLMIESEDDKFYYYKITPLGRLILAAVKGQAV